MSQIIEWIMVFVEWLGMVVYTVLSGSFLSFLVVLLVLFVIITALTTVTKKNEEEKKKELPELKKLKNDRFQKKMDYLQGTVQRREECRNFAIGIFRAHQELQKAMKDFKQYKQDATYEDEWIQNEVAVQDHFLYDTGQWTQEEPEELYNGVKVTRTETYFYEQATTVIFVSEKQNVVGDMFQRYERLYTMYEQEFNKGKWKSKSLTKFKKRITNTKIAFQFVILAFLLYAVNFVSKLFFS